MLYGSCSVGKASASVAHEASSSLPVDQVHRTWDTFRGCVVVGACGHQPGGRGVWPPARGPGCVATNSVLRVTADARLRD